MSLPHIIIYTDGSCRGNPGPGGWGALVATPDHVTELGGREAHTTNNRMELVAAIRALGFVRDLGDAFQIDMRPDSKYTINGITSWVFGWQKNGWRNNQKEPVLNRELWEELVRVVSDLEMSGSKISWTYARGHAGIPGNERADEIATTYADGNTPELFNAARATYPVSLELTTPNLPPHAKKKTPKSAKAYSYLSLVGGVLTKHATWAECERVVKGAPGAKFKKTHSADDEKAVIASWGL